MGRPKKVVNTPMVDNEVVKLKFGALKPGDTFVFPETKAIHLKTEVVFDAQGKEQNYVCLRTGDFGFLADNKNVVLNVHTKTAD